MFELIEKVLSQDRFLNQENKILLVGPEDNTMEIFLRSIPDDTNGLFLTKPDKGVFYDCDNCKYRFICRKGKYITNGKLGYQADCFHRIFLLANSKLESKNPIQNITPLLSPNGQIILFVCNDNNRLNDFSYRVEEITPSINLNELEIQSITNMKNGKDSVMCLIASKR
jgi:hypothetical protein